MSKRRWYVWRGNPDGTVVPVTLGLSRNEALRVKKQLSREYPHLYYEVHEGQEEG